MKRRMVLAMLACLTSTAMALAGCAGGGSTGGLGNPSGDPDGGARPASEHVVAPDISEFTLDSWDVEITFAEVMFDEGSGYDNLVIYTKATNNLDGERKFEPNVVTMQNDDYVGGGSITDASGKSLFTSVDDLPTCKKGESCERVFTYRIEDYDAPILCNFGGYTVAVEDTLVTFDVSGKQTDEAREAAEERQAELEEQMATASVDLELAEVTAPEGWYIETSNSASCQVVPVDGSGYVTVGIDQRSAAEARDATDENFGGGNPVDEVTINGVTWLRLAATDKQVHLFADTSSGKAIHMSSMHHTYEEALPVFESVTLR